VKNGKIFSAEKIYIIFFFSKKEKSEKNFPTFFLCLRTCVREKKNIEEN
jgi:hypothetical protein